jgi:hypothetical protein
MSRWRIIGGALHCPSPRASTAGASGIRLSAKPAAGPKDYIVPLFAFVPSIRKMIYTTDAVEALHRSLRNIIKTRPDAVPVLKKPWRRVEGEAATQDRGKVGALYDNVPYRPIQNQAWIDACVRFREPQYQS